MFLDLLSNQVFQTIIAGVFVFITSQYILLFIIEPFREYKRVIARIDNKLKFYSNVIVNPPFSDALPEDYLIAKQELRQLSCELESAYKMLPLHRHRRDKTKISEAVRDLIWLSNATGHKDNTGTVNVPLMANDKIKVIREKLKIQEL